MNLKIFDTEGLTGLHKYKQSYRYGNFDYYKVPNLLQHASESAASVEACE